MLLDDSLLFEDFELILQIGNFVLEVNWQFVGFIGFSQGLLLLNHLLDALFESLIFAFEKLFLG